MKDIGGKVAVVTGASRGLGRAIAQTLFDHGMKVVVSARGAEELESFRKQLDRSGSRSLAVPADVTSDSDRGSLVAAAKRKFGSIDVLVNNAGTNPAFGPVIEQDHGRFAKTFDVNLWAPVLWTALATKAWMGEHGGSVINTASIGGLAHEAGLGVYNTTKAALIYLTKQLALELSPKIRVNSVAPGVVRTRLAEALWKEHEQELAAAIALNRIGEPDDVAAAIVFLASDAAAWITGETMVIDGGLRLGNAVPYRRGVHAGG